MGFGVEGDRCGGEGVGCGVEGWGLRGDEFGVRACNSGSADDCFRMRESERERESEG